MNIPNKLYHYTTAENAFNIINTNIIRARDIRNLNDKMEGKLVKKILKKVLKNEKYTELSKRFDNENFFDFFDSFECYDFFTISFTDKIDDFNHWQNYGDNGKGYCIEFDTKKLKENFYNNIDHEISQSENIDISVNKIILQKCVYDEKKLIEELEILLAEADKQTETVLGLIPKLLKLSTRYKENKYANESEWRFVLSFTSDEIKKFNLKNQFCEMKIINNSHDSLNIQYDWLGKIFSGIKADENDFLNKFTNEKLREFIAEKIKKSKII